MSVSAVPTSVDPADVLAWYERGDRAAGSRLVEALRPRVALPASFARAVGAPEAEEIEQDALVRLLDRDRRVLIEARDPFAFAATIARNLARDALRRHRRRGDLAESREPVENEASPTAETEDGSASFDARRALNLLDALGDDARLAVFLVHAPDRIPEADWAIVEGRQTTGTVHRPDRPLDRDEASSLLWPPPLPETQPARRRRLERIRKVLSRAYAQLAAALEAG